MNMPKCVPKALNAFIKSHWNMFHASVGPPELGASPDSYITSIHHCLQIAELSNPISSPAHCKKLILLVVCQAGRAHTEAQRFLVRAV